MTRQLSKPRVVIIGGGFAGLTVAKNLKNANVEVILIDKTNCHLFQPLLYQVATAALSPGDIASPLRAIVRNNRNVQTIMAYVERIDAKNRKVILEQGEEVKYDYLIVAPGARHSYFGHDEWEKYAPGLKSIDDALEIRDKLLVSFENAERHYHTELAKKYLTFIIVGGGPTGIELAGSIAEVSMKTMLPDFPLLKREDVNIYLVEGGDRLLNAFPPELSEYAKTKLEKLGVKLIFGRRVNEINADGARIGDKFVQSANIIWAAGNEASPLIKTLDTSVDGMGRALVELDLSIKEDSDVFVLGDAAHYELINGEILPGTAPVALQEAKYVAKLISARIPKKDRKPFKYFDKGSLATIGRAKAVAFKGKTKFKGLFAWIMWIFVHIFFLIGFRNRYRVMFEWVWYYITFQPGARIIFKKRGK